MKQQVKTLEQTADLIKIKVGIIELRNLAADN